MLWGENGNNTKLTERDIIEIRHKYASGQYSHKKLAKEYNTDKKNILLIIKHKAWTHINAGEPEFKQRVGASKLNEIIVTEIREKYKTGNYSQKELSIEYNVCENTIYQLIGYKTWKHVH